MNIKKRPALLFHGFQKNNMKKPIISKFNELPKTKVAWWAMGLGLTMIFSGPIMGIFAAVIRPLIDITINENVGSLIGFGLIPILFILLISALVCSILAFKRGERSWSMWVGLIPSILACTFWVFMIVGEFFFPH